MNVLNEINEFVNLSYQLNAARTKLRKQTIQFRKALNNNHHYHTIVDNWYNNINDNI